MKTIRVYVDDVRPTPKGYLRCRRAKEALLLIEFLTKLGNAVEVSLDHDAGDYGPPDYIQILNWLEEKEHMNEIDCSNMTFHFHSANPVGVENMRRIVEKNGWKEVK
ncbi:MAG: hypothetical protein J6V44_18265 [Methanobrevibacter sp.]|nr:hypothetical protein [Methanobrevibacter sp.]